MLGLLVLGCTPDYTPPNVSDRVAHPHFGVHQIEPTKGVPIGQIIDRGSDRLTPADRDADGVLDVNDNCKESYNPTQLDRDKDGLGDACDARPDVRTFTVGGQSLSVTRASSQTTQARTRSQNERFVLESRVSL